MMLLAFTPTRYIRRALFEQLGATMSVSCGQYGGDDIDFNEAAIGACVHGPRATRRVAGEGSFFQSGAGRKADFSQPRAGGESSDGADGMRISGCQSESGSDFRQPGSS